MEVTNKCLKATILTTPIIDQSYTITKAALPINIDQWTDSMGGVCGAITYSAFNSDGSALNSRLITLAGSQFSVFSLDPTFV